MSCDVQDQTFVYPRNEAVIYVCLSLAGLAIGIWAVVQLAMKAGGGPGAGALAVGMGTAFVVVGALGVVRARTLTVIVSEEAIARRCWGHMLTIPLADVDLLDIGPNPIWGIVSRLRRVDAVIVIKAGPKRLCISRRLREVATQALIGQVLLSLIPTKKQSDRVLARPEVLLRDDTIERI